MKKLGFILMSALPVLAQEGGTSPVTAITGAAEAANTGFTSILTSVAPLAIGLVVGVAGVRLAIKLFNRAVGK